MDVLNNSFFLNQDYHRNKEIFFYSLSSNTKRENHNGEKLDKIIEKENDVMRRVREKVEELRWKKAHKMKTKAAQLTNIIANYIYM